MTKKVVRAGPKRRPPHPSQDPAKPDYKRVRTKSTSTLESKIQDQLAKAGLKPFGPPPSKEDLLIVNWSRKRLIGPGSSLQHELFGYGVRRIKERKDQVYEDIYRQLTTSGRTLEPKAEEMLKDAVSEARLYIESMGSPHREIQRAEISLNIFIRSFAVARGGRISAGLMQRKMKRWLPCPPFCKGPARDFVRKDRKDARKFSSRKAQKGL